jgi:transposase
MIYLLTESDELGQFLRIYEPTHAMPTPTDTVSKNKACELLKSHWRPDTIARKIHRHPSTVYRWETRVQLYGTIDRPPHLRLPTGRPRRIHTAAIESLLEFQKQNPWVYQDEMAIFLEEEWGITVNKSTICRLLKKHRISNKKGQRLGHTQSQSLRTAWQSLMLDVTAEQLVFLDESIFKQQTGWRLMAYGPIGQPARYSDDMTRGETWSILPAYTTEGYLPCTGIRKGFFNGDAFVSWVVNELLPHLNPFPQPRSVICLDNLNVHLDHRIRHALEAKGCLIKFLPPYSPD